MHESDNIVQVLLVDDHSLMREGLHHILARHDGILVVGEAANGVEALELVRELHPDVVLVDISMPDMNGIELTRRIVTDFKGVRVVVLSVHTEPQIVLGALKAGASGYLQKNCTVQELFDEIFDAEQGRPSSSLSHGAECVQEYLNDTGGPTLRGQALSNREREVLHLLAEGNNTKEIAFTLDISIKTVEFHRQQIMKKLNIYNLAELTKYAVREGLTSL